jgi:hypothetical protein
MRTIRIAAALATFAATVWAAQPTPDAGKKIWEMSDEERVAARLSPTTGGTVRAQSAGAHSAPANGIGHRESVDGRHHPELFLPYELFDILVGGLSDDVTTRSNVRRTADPGIKQLGYDLTGFWSALRTASAEYVQLKERQPEVRRTKFLHFTSSSGKSVTVLQDPARCAARIAALNRARRTFGASSFDRLLYTVVAPETKHSSIGTEPNRGEQLLFFARGCK